MELKCHVLGAMPQNMQHADVDMLVGGRGRWALKAVSVKILITT